MKNEVAVIDPNEFGLDVKKAKTIAESFTPMVAEHGDLNEMAQVIFTSELTPELAKEARGVRLKLVKTRTGISKIHKAEKSFYLAGGKFVDAYKNKYTVGISLLEDRLLEVETHFERIEEAKKEATRTLRNASIDVYGSEHREGLDTAYMSQSAFDGLILGLETAKKLAIKDAEIQAKKEEERLEDIRLEQAKIAKENEAIRVENALLKEEAFKKEEARLVEENKVKEEAARVAKIEADKQAKIQAETDRLKEEARVKEAKDIALFNENKEKERLLEKDKADRIEAELSKGDAAKLKDLIADLDALKTKYSFKSKKNKAKMVGVAELMSKVIVYINK
tara:strand:+ start:503 stop:1513 length:1011 start_codon:yes stop_codon:yes gene_type:complete